MISVGGKKGDLRIFGLEIFMIFWSKFLFFMLIGMSIWALGWAFGSTYGYYKVTY